MGLRGPGAARAKAAREKAEELDRDLPWEKRGLTRAQRVIAFLEFLPVTKGRRVGENMVLLPKQRRFVRRVYGRVVKNRGSQTAASATDFFAICQTVSRSQRCSIGLLHPK